MARFTGAASLLLLFLPLVPGVAGNGQAAEIAAAPVSVLDVPYVPQSELLCGGAALAMVFRFWGETGAVAEDFGSNLDPEGVGIRADQLAEAARARGWSCRPWHASPHEVQQHLRQGRPIIALIDAGSSTLHYIVITAWPNRQVLYHDPATNPFRVMSEDDFLKSWNASQRWALLVLPGERSLIPPDASDIAVVHESDRRNGIADSARSDSLDLRIAQAVELARNGDMEQARVVLQQAHAEFPESPAPLRELAGLAFLEEEWEQSGRLAASALERDPSDSLSLRILAGSRFLDGDVEGALQSWNRLQEPRLDLAEVQGSNRIRYRTITDQLGLRHGELVTSPSFRHAKRRLREIPAISDSRISLVPDANGDAHVEVVVSERPLLPRNPRSLLRIGARTIATRELLVSSASPTGNGELWTVSGRWSKERPLIALSLSIPNPGSRPGTWRIDGGWERQAFHPEMFERTGFVPTDDDSTQWREEFPLVREERRRTAVSLSDWVLPDVRMSLGLALDRWNRGAHYFAIEDEIEFRLGGDRLACTTWGSAWVPLRSSERTFHAGRAVIAWESSGIERADSWGVRAGVHATSRRAPASIWPATGLSQIGGFGRTSEAALLRAHPLLENDVVRGAVFGPAVWSSGLEKRTFPWSLGFLRLGAAAYVDAAGLLNSTDSTGRWQVDAGIGFLVREFGSTETVRVDLGHGLRDGAWALSLSWNSVGRN